ncbi:MAG: GIY-YIG nuclease family protein [Proteobacteria bacterium]|jgi:putative endonuclease|nr:GIY-YIG nuclease family protein [Pseudomonadota bacterium]
MQYYVYILASQPNGTLYIGRTDDLVKRVWQHKQKFVKSFTSKYAIDKLVYFEVHQDAGAIVQRERRLKTWERAWKVALIEKENPNWVDLYEEITK